MQFTEAEVAFLIQPHKVETADRHSHRSLAAAQDLRSIGCPAHIFERVLETRAKQLGPKFSEFRKQHVAHQDVRSVINMDDLDIAVAASGLF